MPPLIRDVLLCAALLLPPLCSWAQDAAPQPPLSIVVSPAAPQVTQFAAKELQTYLHRISGQRLPIVPDDPKPQGRLILVGKSRLTDEIGVRPDFTPESFIIKNAEGGLVLMGDDKDAPFRGPIPFYSVTSRKGTLFAVYTLLDRFFGVRWLWPGPTGEVVPRAKDIVLPEVDIVEKPDFAWRHFWYTAGDVTPRVRDEEVPLWYMRNRCGIAFGSGSSFAHAYTGLMEGNKNYDAHPDWYALVNGKRQPFPLDPKGKPEYKGAQVCTGNPEVVAQFVKQLRKADPGALAIASISPNDGMGFCECPQCKALDHPELYRADEGYEPPVLSDRLFSFANAVARGIRETHPLLHVGAFSYTVGRAPPRSIPRLEPNIVVSMTQINALYADPARKASARKRIDEWAAKHDKFVARDYLGLYDWLNVVHLQTRILAEDLKYLKTRNYIGFYSENSLDFASNHLNHYVAARLLWKVDQNLDAIIDDYCAKAYGPAAATMRRYYTLLEDSFANRPMTGADYGGGLLPQWITPDLIAQARALLDKAEAQAPGDEVRARVQYVRIGLDITAKTASFIRVCQKLTDAGLVVRVRGYEKQPLSAQPSREAIVAWIKDAREKLSDLFAFLDSLKDTSACQAFCHNRYDEIYRWRATLDSYHDLYAASATERAVVQLPLEWRFKTDPANQGEASGWARRDFDDASWPDIRVDAQWEKQGYDGYDGFAWYRLSGVQGPDTAGARSILRFGAVDESCWVYVNGRLAGAFQYDPDKDPDAWKKPREFDVTALIEPGGKNVIAVKVHDQGYAGGIWQGVFLAFDKAAPQARQSVFFEGFEKDGWDKAVTAGGKSSEASVVEGDAYEGKRCLLLKVNAPLPALGGVSSGAIPVQPGASYAVSVFYKIESAQENASEESKTLRRPALPAARVIFHGADHKPCVAAKDYVWARAPFREKTDGWQDLKVVFSAPAAAKTLSLALHFAAQGQYRVDAISVERW